VKTVLYLEVYKKFCQSFLHCCPIWKIFGRASAHKNLLSDGEFCENGRCESYTLPRAQNALLSPLPPPTYILSNLIEIRRKMSVRYAAENF
jgi:hypothetical protein